MTTKKPNDHAFELEQGLQVANLTKRQTENQALLKAYEKADISGYNEDRDLINQLIGHVQMAEAVSKFATVVGLTKLKYIKESKLYRVLTGKTADEKTSTVATWEDFCRLIGTSAGKVNEDLKHLEIFGEEALESLNRIGAGYRELRKLRRLPEHERELIINGVVANAGDKEALAELIEEMAARHAKEKETLEKRTEDLKGNLEATRRVIEDKNTRITELETEVHKKAALAPDERAAELSKRLEHETFCAKSGFLGPRSVIREIMEWEDAPRDLTHACAQAVARLRITLDELQSDFMLPVVDLDIDDSWMNETE